MRPATPIFVIDDDEAIRDALSYALAAIGYTVRTFGSGIAFLDHLPDGAAGVVLSDIRLPGMDGLALTRRMKAAGSALPVILVTGHADHTLRAEAMDAGASAVLEKPCELRTLLAEIERVSHSPD